MHEIALHPCCAGGDTALARLLRAVWICMALLMQTEAESERAELDTEVVFRWGTHRGMSKDARICLRVDKHAGGP